jgi:cytochrome c oxidase subunit 4
MTDSTEAPGPGTDVAVTDEGGAIDTLAELAVEPVEEHSHPDAKQYVLIAVVLVIVTALEIATSYIDTGHTNWIIIALGAMAIVKFVLVTGWYMHMKTDHPLFRRFFIVGIILASIVYGVVFMVFSSTVLKS